MGADSDMIPNSDIKKVLEELQSKRVACYETGKDDRAAAFTISIQLLRQVLYNADIPSVRLSTDIERIE